MRRRPPKATRTDTTLSLHDALPICLAGLAGADAHGLTHFEDENLAVADRAGAGALLKRFDDPCGERIVADEFDLHLGHHVGGIFGAAVDFGLSLLPAEALDLDRKSTRLNSSHKLESRMASSA